MVYGASLMRPLSAAGVSPGDSAATRIVKVAQAQVGVRFNDDECAALVTNIANLAGVPYFGGNGAAPNPTKSSTWDYASDSWELIRWSGSVSEASIKANLQPGDILRGWDGYGPHSAIVTQVIDMPDGSRKIIGVDNLDGIKGNAATNTVAEHDLFGAFGQNNVRTFFDDSATTLVHRVAGNWTVNGTSQPEVLFGGAGNDKVSGGAGNDTLHGAGSNDTMQGGTGDDVINGDGGSDSLVGGSGNDMLAGGSGGDTLVGGADRDILTGGSSSDIFRFNAISESKPGAAARDVITDFVRGADRIDLDAIDANPSRSGDQDFSWHGTSAFTGADQVRYFVSNGNAIVQMDWDGDRKADLEIEVRNVTSLSASDFLGLI